jgi:hypothetical protein
MEYIREMREETSQQEPKTPLEILSAAIRKINEKIAPLVALSIEIDKTYIGNKAEGSRNNALIKLTRQSRTSTFAVEIKKTAEIRDIQNSVNQIRERDIKNKKLEPMIVQRYLSEPAQRWLREQQISYADATGNFMLSSPSMNILVMSDAGAKRDPWRPLGRPRNSLKGEPVARIVRSLIENTPPYSLPMISKLSESSSGVTYRTVDYLVRQNLIELENVFTGNRKTSRIISVDWLDIIEAWSKEYSFMQSNSVKSYFEPRGINEVVKNLRKINPKSYAVTGSVAASNYEKYAEAKQIRIYAKDRDDLVIKLGLREVESGANVQIAATEYDSVFRGTAQMDGISVVALPQIAVDLLSGPGRNPIEGKAILDWMSTNEDTWRKT